MHSTASAVIARWGAPAYFRLWQRQLVASARRTYAGPGEPSAPPPERMRQALQTLRWFRQDIGIEGQTTEG